MEYQSEIGVFIYDEGKIARKFSEDMLKDLAKKTSNLGQEEAISSLIEELVNCTCNEVIYIPAERGVVSFLSQKYAAMDRKEFTHLFPETRLSSFS